MSDRSAPSARVAAGHLVAGGVLGVVVIGGLALALVPTGLAGLVAVLIVGLLVGRSLLSRGLEQALLGFILGGLVAELVCWLSVATRGMGRT